LYQLDDNGLVTYSLSADEKIRAYLHRLALLDWSTAMSLKKELKDMVVCYQDSWRDSKYMTR
jgi:hypothetical protein